MKDILLLRDLLTKNKPIHIMYRCNSPEPQLEEDMLYGYCEWDGKELKSTDGDNYYLNDLIEKYEFDSNYGLIVWISVLWNSNKKDDCND